jgi:hypothetical protein
MRSAPPSSTGHGDLTASFVLIFPILLAYEIGVLFAGNVNGADVITRAVYAAVGGRTLYLALYVAIAIGFVWWIRRGRYWGTLRIEVVAPVVLEAATYALTLGAVGMLIVERLLGLGLTGTAVVSALGAGVHEELVFRLGILSGLVHVFSRQAIDRRAGFVLALGLAAFAFALAHHLGAYGEPWSTHAFAFRCVAGIAFGLIYWFRSLAHAVYAHVLYDLVIAIR